MMLRTHLAFGILFILLFIPHVSSKIVFGLVALIATIIPDIDTGFSTIGSNKLLKFFHFFVRHRGFIHSLTIAFLLALLFAFFMPVVSLGIFLGYSLHVFIDGFTPEGVMPFWPLRKKSSWHIKTGGRIETSLFFVLLSVDILVFLIVIF